MRQTPVTARESFALVVRSEDRQLLTVLNQSLATLQQSGQLDQIEIKWLDSVIVQL